MNPVEYAKKKEKLYLFFRRRNINPWDTEDLIQDVLLKLWRIGKPIDTCDQAYVYTVARTLMIDKFRLDSRQHRASQVSTDMDGLVDQNATTPEYQLQEQRLLEQLERDFNNLTVLQRQTFVESKIKGLKVQEIAEGRNVSVSAVEKIISKATHSIKQGVHRNECA